MTISLIVVIVPLLHLFLTGNSPLFDLLFGNFTKNEISNERELYSKFQVPYIFSIITNLTIFFMHKPANLKS
jgi:hypothetical protein